MTRHNPYIVPGARVRVVDHNNCPVLIVNGQEHTVDEVSNDGKFITVSGASWLHVSRFKPVVRRRMGRRHQPANHPYTDTVMQSARETFGASMPKVPCSRADTADGHYD